MAQKVAFAGQMAWHKTYPTPCRWRTPVFNGLVRFLGLNLLATPPRAPGLTPAEEEAAHLRRLAAQGVRVPAVYRATPTALWLEDLGPSLASQLKRQPRVDRIPLARAACIALAQVHRQGAWLGQAFARNLAVDAQGHIGFLDVENDPTVRMSLAQAQARDWLCLTESLAHRVDHLDRFLALGLATADPAVHQALTRATRRLHRWVSWWPRSRATQAVLALQMALAQTAPLFEVDTPSVLA